MFRFKLQTSWLRGFQRTSDRAVTAICPKHKTRVSSTSSTDGVSRTDSLDPGGSTTNWETMGFKRTCKSTSYIKKQISQNKNACTKKMTYSWSRKGLRNRYHKTKMHVLKNDIFMVQERINDFPVT
jgi:hypothetical protein